MAAGMNNEFFLDKKEMKRNKTQNERIERHNAFISQDHKLDTVGLVNEDAESEAEPEQSLSLVQRQESNIRDIYTGPTESKEEQGKAT